MTLKNFNYLLIFLTIITFLAYKKINKNKAEKLTFNVNQTTIETLENDFILSETLKENIVT